MTSRPVIFISAVSKELKSARALVAKTLLSLGYDPKWQDIEPTQAGDVQGLLRKWVEDSHAVIQLVGKCYGLEPREVDAEFGRVSLTQYEALYARKLGKKVWHLVIGDSFTPDPHEPEPEELRQLQQDYRARVQAAGDLYHHFDNSHALEAVVLRLRDDLALLRRRWKLWAAAVIALLGALAAGGGWLIWHQSRIARDQAETQRTVKETDAKVSGIVERYQKMEQALVRLADAEMHAKPLEEKLAPEQLRERAYAILEKEIGLASGTLSKELPAFALELYSRADTTLLMKMRAAYALGKYEEAEALGLQSVAQDRKAYENANRVAEQLRKSQMEALEMAGLSARKQLLFPRALKHFQDAAALTSEGRDPVEWAHIQHSLSLSYHDMGDYREALLLLRRLTPVQERILGASHRVTLQSRKDLAEMLRYLGEYTESEAEQRLVLAELTRQLGPEAPDTLGSRICLGCVLNQQDKSAEAEVFHRETLEILTRVRGAEHSSTLTCRMLLAAALARQEKFEEAEGLERALLPVMNRVLGPDHLNTLRTRSFLVIALRGRGRDAEALAELRLVLAAQERVLGPQHPDTLGSRTDLAELFEDAGQLADAEKEYRTVLGIRRQQLGDLHPDVLDDIYNLALCLEEQEKLKEALDLVKQAETGFSKALGSDHENAKDAKEARQRIEAALHRSLRSGEKR